MRCFKIFYILSKKKMFVSVTFNFNIVTNRLVGYFRRSWPRYVPSICLVVVSVDSTHLAWVQKVYYQWSSFYDIIMTVYQYDYWTSKIMTLWWEDQLTIRHQFVICLLWFIRLCSYLCSCWTWTPDLTLCHPFPCSPLQGDLQYSPYTQWLRPEFQIKHRTTH